MEEWFANYFDPVNVKKPSKQMQDSNSGNNTASTIRGLLEIIGGLLGDKLELWWIFYN